MRIELKRGFYYFGRIKIRFCPFVCHLLGELGPACPSRSILLCHIVFFIWAHLLIGTDMGENKSECNV